MDKPILTIIVPVYNVEEYLEECYQSIFGEDVIEQIEIILVDDGSNDNSGNICDKLAKNKNTYVIHKTNGGLASARNEGLKKANGKYIMFIDSDDKVETKSLKKIIDYISKTNTDLIFLNINKLYEDGETKDIGEHINSDMLVKRTKDECIRYISRRPKFPASACAKIYLKKYLDENNICFPNDNRISEDMGFSFKCIISAKSFDKINLPFYYYRQNRKNSITSHISSKNFNGLSKFIIESINLYTKDGFPKNKNIKNMFNFLAYEYTILLWQYNFLNDVDKKYALQFLKEYKYVMKWSLTINNRIIAILLKILRIKTTSKLLYYIKRVI